MPILSNRPSSTPPPETLDSPKEPVVTEPSYRGETVDTKYESRRSLLTHVEGSPWQVTYYQQLVAQDSELSAQQLDKDPVYQQYTRIRHLELRVTSELSHDQRDDTKSFDVTGTAILYPPMVPNKGDMFLADIGDGREGVFAVAQTERLSIMREACYQIQYTLVSFSTEERRTDLEAKTVKRTHFIKRLLEHGEDPIVVDDTYHQYLSLQEYWGRLLGRYMGQFYDKSTSTLLVPNQDCPTYDPFLVKFIASFISSTQQPLLRHTRKYAVDLPNRNLPWTLWDAILNVSDAMLPMVEEQLSLVPSQCFGVLPQYEGVHFSNVARVVYPHNPKEPLYPTEGLASGQAPPTNLNHQFDTTRLNTLAEYPTSTGTDGTVLPPAIVPVTRDGYYVLSEAFYRGDKERQTQLERLVQGTLNREAINQSTLTDLCDQAHRWPLLEQFYYVPLLLVMIKMAVRGQ